jgi:hypothetical protein
MALLEHWKEALQRYQNNLREHELKDIRDFQGPREMVEDLRTRLYASAQGRLRNLLSQITPFFETLQELMSKFTKAMPVDDVPVELVSGGAYLAVKVID